MRHPRRTDELTLRALNWILDWVEHIKICNRLEKDNPLYYNWQKRDQDVCELVQLEIKLYNKNKQKS
jgi:hypothetical protein